MDRHHSRSHPTRRRALVGLALGAILAVTVAVAAPAGAAGDPLCPLAPLPAGVPWTGAYATQQHRVREAEGKARAGMRRQKAEAARDKSVAKAMADYDVHYYRLAIDLNTATRILSGTTTIAATVTGSSLTQMTLDFGSQCAVLGARVSGAATTFNWSLGVLTVDLDMRNQHGQPVMSMKLANLVETRHPEGAPQKLGAAS